MTTAILRRRFRLFDGLQRDFEGSKRKKFTMTVDSEGSKG
jgi:hypothetical protein